MPVLHAIFTWVLIYGVNAIIIAIYVFAQRMSAISTSFVGPYFTLLLWLSLGLVRQFDVYIIKILKKKE